MTYTYWADWFVQAAVRDKQELGVDALRYMVEVGRHTARPKWVREQARAAQCELVYRGALPRHLVSFIIT